MKTIFSLFLFIISLTGIAQTNDCNLDSACVKMVLVGMSQGWKLVETKGLNWEGSKCPESTDFYFEFNINGELNIYQKTIDCHNNITKNIHVYQTVFKIVSINNFGQLGVRISKFHSNMQSLLYRTINEDKISDYVDFQFLYSKQNNQLSLRFNTNLKQEKSIVNKFE